MNWSQFTDPVSHICPASAAVASFSLTQDITGSNPFTVITNNLVTESSENI